VAAEATFLRPAQFIDKLGTDPIMRNGKFPEARWISVALICTAYYIGAPSRTDGEEFYAQLLKIAEAATLSTNTRTIVRNFSAVRAGLVADPIVAGPHVHERLIRLGVIAAYLLVLVFSWNEYFMAVNLTSANAQTMPILIFNQSTGRQLAWWTMAAMATTSIAPMIVIGLVLEKYIVAGLQAGALKG